MEKGLEEHSLGWKINLQLPGGREGYGFKVYTDGFAVLWNEDHDRRIFDAVSQLSSLDLLQHVVFLQKHKGWLTIALNTTSKKIWELFPPELTILEQDNWFVHLKSVCDIQDVSNLLSDRTDETRYKFTQGYITQFCAYWKIPMRK